MIGDADDLVRKLRAAGEATRLRALFLLSFGELSVGELAQLLGQSQPGLSRHMKFLTDAGLVERLPEGAWVFYRLPASGEGRRAVDALLALIDAQAEPWMRERERLNAVRAARVSEAEAFFNAIADDWDRVRRLHLSNEAIESGVLTMAGPGPFRRVLDIGTGTGRMLALFSRLAESGEGIDLSHRMLTLARANLDREGIRNALVRRGDALALPFASASADLVVIHQVLHFLDRPSAALAEGARVLMPGGRLVLVDFAPHELEFLRTEHGHRRLGLSADEVENWAQACGLRPLELRRFEPPAGLSDALCVMAWAFDAPGRAAVNGNRNVPEPVTEMLT